MTLRTLCSLSAALTLLGSVSGCGSASGIGLFGSSGDSAPPPINYNAPPSSGGSTSVFIGDLGGSPSSGGFQNAGGDPGTGGQPFLDTGGAPQGAGGSTLVIPSFDAGGFNPLSCDYSGTWATFASVPVTWPSTIAILPGGGNLNQWTLSQQVQDSPGQISLSTIPCGITTPDFQTNLFGGSSAFGIRFPDSLFDSNGIPAAKFKITASIDPNGGFAFASSAFAFTIGFKMDNPTTAAWPATTSITSVDQDGDQHPGVTIFPATGVGYSYPPTSIPFPGTPLADLLYLAQRTVSTLNGRLTSCDQMNGHVTIAVLSGVAAIDSSIIGCHVQNASDCNATQSSFIDQNRPVFTPSGPGSMISVRLPNGATCADARARFPSPS
jgi:hypothetical protein